MGFKRKIIDKYFNRNKNIDEKRKKIASFFFFLKKRITLYSFEEKVSKFTLERLTLH